MRSDPHMKIRTLFLTLALAVFATAAAEAKDRATFLTGQYATDEQCAKLRKIESGTEKNVSTVPELLDAEGFHSWEGGCEFTKVFEHEPGSSWLAFMICSEGASITPETYVFTKHENEDGFVVSHSNREEAPETYKRCDANIGN